MVTNAALWNRRYFDRPSSGGESIDYRSSGIAHRVWAQLISRATGATVGYVTKDLRAFTLEKNLNATTRNGATLDLAVTQDIDWSSVVVRLWLVLTLGAWEETHPLITGYPTVSGYDRKDGAVDVDVTIKDMTSVLDDVLGKNVAYPAGTLAVSVMSSILDDLHVRDYRVESSPATLQTAITAKPGDTWRSVVTAIAEHIGYAAAWSDPRGKIILAPYLAPEARAEVFTVGYDERSISLPSVAEERKTEAANHFVLTTGGESPLVAEGWNTDPLSPFSTVNQRIIAHYEQVEADSQATLNAKLTQVMADEVRPNTSYTVSHRWFPLSVSEELELQDAGRIVAPARVVDGQTIVQPLDAKVTLTKQSFTWSKGEPLSVVQAEFRGVE